MEPIMENEVLKEIHEFAHKKLREAYGYCVGSVSSDTAIVSAADSDGHNITVVTKIYNTDSQK